MVYTLKHFDVPLLRFSVEGSAEPEIKVIWQNEDAKHLLPLDLSAVSEAELVSWIRHRTIPKNRAYVDTILNKMGLSLNRPFDVIRLSKGLSLNDCYWVTEDGFDGSFEKYNLYDNRFSRILGEIAFTGYGTSSNTLLTTSPEFTTNGMLPKCWRRENRVIRLYKGGTEGASNSGFEPYSEYYASQLAAKIGVNAIPYGISKWKGKLCSTCELFTSKDISFIPVGRIVRSGGIKAVRKYYEELGEEFVQALNEMIVFDALIFNTDRHYGNFGFLVDNNTNRIIAPAPLFDHGNSLLNFAGNDAWTDEKSIWKYASIQKPRVYDDFAEEARKYITHEQKSAIRALLNVKFKRHVRYNLNPKRLELLEYVIHRQAQELLK
ncbi:MAG: XRE family transcriptional regulator [Eubacteriales bacterium]|nr:XRE family transcriptional regulator [Eubacteriales bacterium]